ncbi:MAG: N-6 DNA methylase, partial [Candidatus Riflebacteria bacterium]|nr:N-6 DNA methylase [Candidatus Riflebacteria bacterium]
MTITTLFGWFNNNIAAVYKISPDTSPAETLHALGAPASLSDVFLHLIDCKIACKQTDEGLVPDLEQREKGRKRSSGQFYTPENLAARLVKLAGPLPAGKLLDPACGDGSFLMATARLLEQTSASLLRTERNNIFDERKNLFLERIYGYDIDLQALFICLTRLICAFPGCGWPVLEQRDFLLEPPTQQFSLVIGNPPYRVNLDADVKRQLLKLYSTGEGEKDLYTFFIEAGSKALKPDGRLVLLTSHTWLVNHQCNKIRQFIFAEHTVKSLLMLPERFFSLAPGVLPVIVLADKTKPSAELQLKVMSDYSETQGWNREYLADASLFLSNSGLRQAIVPVSLKKVFAKMEACGATLGRCCRVGVGIQESLKRDGRVSRYVADTALSPRHRPVLRGRELAAFKIKWEGNYIDYGPHLAYAGCETTFSGPKLLYQNIRNEKLKMRLVAAF